MDINLSLHKYYDCVLLLLFIVNENIIILEYIEISFTSDYNLYRDYKLYVRKLFPDNIHTNTYIHTHTHINIRIHKHKYNEMLSFLFDKHFRLKKNTFTAGFNYGNLNILNYKFRFQNNCDIGFKIFSWIAPNKWTHLLNSVTSPTFTFDVFK